LKDIKQELKHLPQLQQESETKLAEWERANLYQDEGNKGEALGYAATSFRRRGLENVEVASTA